MKLFGSGSNRRRDGESSALDEFSFHMPAQNEERNKRLEIECFRKKREFDVSQNNHMISKHINSLESLKSDTDSDYDSMPRSQESELCSSLNKFRLTDTLPHFYERQSTECGAPLMENDHDRLHERSSIDSNDSMIEMAQTNCAVTKVLLFPEEEWARNAKSIQWTIKFNRWWKRLCIVTESSIGGSHVKSAEAKVIQNGEGSLTIVGRFKRLENPDFELHLSTNISRSDTQKGYIMTGDLHQGDLSRFGRLEITHFAAITKEQ